MAFYGLALQRTTVTDLVSLDEDILHMFQPIRVSPTSRTSYSEPEILHRELDILLTRTKLLFPWLMILRYMVQCTSHLLFIVHL